jgi:hypothetical protein
MLGIFLLLDVQVPCRQAGIPVLGNDVLENNNGRWK